MSIFIDEHNVCTPHGESLSLWLWCPDASALNKMLKRMAHLPANGPYTVTQLRDMVPREHQWCSYTIRRTNGGADDGRIEIEARDRMTDVLHASRPIKCLIDDDDHSMGSSSPIYADNSYINNNNNNNNNNINNNYVGEGRRVESFRRLETRNETSYEQEEPFEINTGLSTIRAYTRSIVTSSLF